MKEATKRPSVQAVVSCKSCKYYHEFRLWDGREAGHCKRHAPAPWVGHYEWLSEDANGRSGIGVVQPVWPQVFASDWCGDHVNVNATNADVSSSGDEPEYATRDC
jgi:hypothetical protein